MEDDFVLDVIRRVGAERIAFGSDYSFGSPVHDVLRLLRLPLSHEEKGRIVGECQEDLRL